MKYKETKKALESLDLFLTIVSIVWKLIQLGMLCLFVFILYKGIMHFIPNIQVEHKKEYNIQAKPKIPYLQQAQPLPINPPQVKDIHDIKMEAPKYNIK